MRKFIDIDAICEACGLVNRSRFLAECEHIGAKDPNALLALVDSAVIWRQPQYAVAISTLLKAGVAEDQIPAALQGIRRIVNDYPVTTEVAQSAAEFLAAVAAITGPLEEHQWILSANLVRYAQQIG